MSAVRPLSKADVRRALIRHHFAPAADVPSVFDRLRSIQFDPIAPVGCNHDLVLQSRLPDYQIGDWQKAAYKDRAIYDGWDKQACLVPMASWPVRRYFHEVHRKWFDQRIFVGHKDAVETVLREITERGPMRPKDFEFQARNDAWKGSWFGPSVTKQVLRALWHSGLVMTTDRHRGQHIYDLTERVVSHQLRSQAALSHDEALREIFLERHRAMGILRPSAAQEVWSVAASAVTRKAMIQGWVNEGELVPVDVEGLQAHATPSFLALLDQPEMQPEVRFIAPLDQFLWDRKFIAHTFEFDYIWEIYTPEAKRKWGYYVLPILFGDRLVARVEFYARKGELELRAWHVEADELPPEFWTGLETALPRFMRYSSTQKLVITARMSAKHKAGWKAAAKSR